MWAQPALTGIALAVAAGAQIPSSKVLGYAKDKGKGGILKRRRRMLITNKTGPQAFRPGLRFPRNDARMQDGDEVLIHSSSHTTWLAVTAHLGTMLRGKVTMKGGREHKFCGLLSSKIKCTSMYPDMGSWQPELVDAGWGGRVGIVVHGKLCSDTPGGLSCTKPIPKGHITGWEAMGLVDAGHGLLAIRGGRGKGWCSDQPGGIVCNSPDIHAHETFEIQPDNDLNNLLIQTKDKSKAETFVVGRPMPRAPMVTLRCKGNGLYLQINPQSEAAACSSISPVSFDFVRLDGAKWWNAAKGSLLDTPSGKFLRADGPQWGGHVKADGKEPGGWQLFTIALQAGYEDIFPLIRGVNLGGWFVLEKWMTGSLFKNNDGEDFTDPCSAEDEYGLMDQLSTSVKRSRMEKHWDTWITEDDIIWLAGRGINTVRVPFGYWMAHPEPPFIDGQTKYLEKLFKWCEKHDIAVLLDFHGLKGSQNGAQTSGNCGACGKAVCGDTWTFFLDNQEANLEVIEKMVTRFSGLPAYFGFVIASEVAGSVDSYKTMAFYQKAYDIIRKHSMDSFIFLDSAFQPATYPIRNEMRLAQDDHMYFSTPFQYEASQLSMDRLEEAKGRRLKVSRWQLLVGAWALDHHGQFLGGRPTEQEAWTMNFAKAQLQAYEQHTMGWIYWSYKTEDNTSAWNYRRLCERGWLPGCTSDYDFGPDSWFEHHPCSYAYLDLMHMGVHCDSRILTV